MHDESETAHEVRKQQSIQRGIDARDRKKPEGKAGGAMQAGARDYPEPPFPKQHQAKPGHEGKVEPHRSTMRLTTSVQRSWTAKRRSSRAAIPASAAR